MKNLLKPIALSVAVLGSVGTVATAHAQLPGELSASAGVANMYLWRGIDLGDGSPAVYGDLIYSVSGFYAGIWGSSGDSALGSEYDLFAGWGTEIGGFSVDISLWNYNYSDLEARDDTTGELSEVILTLGYGPVTAQYYDNIAGNTGYKYYTLAGTLGQFTLKAGMHDYKGEPDGIDADMTHLDLIYAYNDRLAFTLSKVIDDDRDAGYDDDLNFVVSYSLPIDL